MAKETATQERQQKDEAPRTKNAVANIAPPRLPYNTVFQERYGVSGMEWRALVDAVFPSAKTVEGVILALSYCKARGLDPMKRPVHIVPIWNSKENREVESVWPGINELRTTAFRTKQYCGCDPTVFGPMKRQHFKGVTGKGQYEKKVEADVEFPEWAQVTVYRLVEGQRCAFPGPRVYWLAAYGCQGKSDVPNDKWQEGGGSYMLEKCAEGASLRKAFPEDLQGMLAAEEMEGRRMESGGSVIDHDPPPPPPRPTRESVKREQEQAQQEDEERNTQFRQTVQNDTRPQPPHDEETGEVHEDESHSPDGPSEPGVSGQPAPPASPETPKRTDKASPPPKPSPEVYIKLAQTLVEKIERVGILKNLNAIIADYAQDIDLLRTESPENYEVVMKVYDTKKAWFSR